MCAEESALQCVEKVLKALFRERLMNVFLRKIAFCYGKLPARPAKPVDTMRVLQMANDCGYMKDYFDSLVRGGIHAFLLHL